MSVHIHIFRRSPDQLALPNGSVIFRAGDPGDCMYVITEGVVAVEYHGYRRAMIGAGEILGEMALIDAGPRSASAITQSDCRLVRIDRQRFLYLVHETPYFALQVMQTLVQRLREERAREA